jgi:hypothetical protein
MFKILIITTMREVGTYGIVCALHTVIAEFDSREDAEFAAKNAEVSNHRGDVRVRKLYK